MQLASTSSTIVESIPLDITSPSDVSSNLTESNPEVTNETKTNDNTTKNVAASYNWVKWYCSLQGNTMFCEIDRSFLEDPFNFASLETLVPCFTEARDIILDNIDTEALDLMSEEQRDIVESAAEMLYGLVHQRFILSTRGLKRMHDKYKNCDFGRCHRVYCRGQFLLPVGQSDVAQVATVNTYCPRCQDIYFPQVVHNIDGAYWGTSFPGLFLLRYPNLVPSLPEETYTIKIYGFKVHSSSLLNRRTTLT
jgi:casein kinase II subunit beta|tara:strand:- start:8 stop:760 length:753 start_codon:yes stop_codon:yes gene_type:complete